VGFFKSLGSIRFLVGFPTKNLIELKLYMNPTKNLIELKHYMNPTKNQIEANLYMNPTKNLIVRKD
jgi:hypothetical protein